MIKQKREKTLLEQAETDQTIYKMFKNKPSCVATQSLLPVNTQNICLSSTNNTRI